MTETQKQQQNARAHTHAHTHTHKHAHTHTHTHTQTITTRAGIAHSSGTVPVDSDDTVACSVDEAELLLPEYTKDRMASTAAGSPAPTSNKAKMVSERQAVTKINMHAQHDLTQDTAQHNRRLT